MEKATFKVTMTVKFKDDGENSLTDQAWDALRQKLPPSFIKDAELIGDIRSKAKVKNDLIELLKAAEQGSRKLDARIADFVGFWPKEYKRKDFHGPDRRWSDSKSDKRIGTSKSLDCPNYTTSIDGAMLLAGKKEKAVMNQAIKTVGPEFALKLPLHICIAAIQDC